MLQEEEKEEEEESIRARYGLLVGRREGKKLAREREEERASKREERETQSSGACVIEPLPRLSLLLSLWWAIITGGIN